ncbi:MAG: hypothetical protein D6772_03945, partial [Bacteroidetes bacterium]
MRKHFKYIFLVLLLGLGVSSCDEYLDINDDPNRLTEVSLASLTPTIQLYLADAQYNVSYTAAQATQQTGSYFGYFEDFTLGGAWTILYLRAMSNANILATQAAAEGADHYQGIALAMQAFGLAMITDTWEDAPWSQAFKGSEVLQPTYEAQSELYKTITSLLDQAETLLNSTVDCETAGNCIKPASDLIYG